MNAKEIVASIFGMVFKIVFVVLVVMFVYKYAFIAYDYGYRIFGEQPITSGEGRTVTVVLPENPEAKQVGEILEMKGLIREAELFVIQELVSDYHNKLLPGEYELNTSMTAEQMMEIMSAPQGNESEDGNKSLDEMSEEDLEQVIDSENNE